MRKRILSVCISCCLMLGVPGFWTSADSTAAQITEETFTLLAALGIDDGVNKNGADLITRAEFTAMAVRSLNIRAHGDYDGSFVDVGEDAAFADEIYMAKSLRMTNGTAQGVFSPEGTVPVPVAVKILLTAMGYEGLAQAKGGYPSGYLAVERQLHLLKNISTAEEMTVNDAKYMMTNALKAEPALIYGVENDTLFYHQNADASLLTEKFNLRECSGIVTGADYLTFDDTIPDKNHLTISGRTFRCRVESAPYFGMEVTAWYGAEDQEVYAIEKSAKNETVTLRAKDILAYTGAVLTAQGETRLKKYHMNKNLSFIKNGRLIAHTDDDFLFPDGNLRLIDNDGDGQYEFAMAEQTAYFVISGIDAVTNTIYDKNSGLTGIRFDSESEMRCLLQDISGAAAAFEDLETDMVVEVIQSDDKKLCIVRTGGSRRVSGTVTETFDKGIAVDGTAYETNSYFKARGIALTIGASYNFLLAADGTVTTIADRGETGIEYGYLIDARVHTASLNGSAQVKLLTERGEIAVFDLADKITLDGTAKVEATSAAVKVVLRNGSYPNYQVIRYRTNDEGKITLMDTADGSIDENWDIPSGEDGQDTLTQYLAQTSVNYRGGASFGAPYFSFKRGVLFAVPEELAKKRDAQYDEKMFTVKTVSDLVNNRNYVTDIYDLDENYYPRAITMYTEVGAGSGSVRTDNASHVICSVADGLDDAGNITKAVTTYSKGRYYKYYLDSDLLDSALPNPGDIVRLTVRGNQVLGMEVDVRYHADTNMPEILYTSGTPTSSLAYISGSVKTIGDGAIALKATWAPGALVNNVAALPLSSPRYVLISPVRGNVTVTTGAVTDVIGESAVGIKNASKVACRLSYYAATDVFIYVD